MHLNSSRGGFERENTNETMSCHAMDSKGITYETKDNQSNHQGGWANDTYCMDEGIITIDQEGMQGGVMQEDLQDRMMPSGTIESGADQGHTGLPIEEEEKSSSSTGSRSKGKQ